MPYHSFYKPQGRARAHRSRPETHATRYTNGNNTSNGSSSGEKVAQAAREFTADGDHRYFVIDTQPMKVDIPSVQRPKRDTTPPNSTETKRHKKAKRMHEGNLPAGEGFEDISGEVDAKLREKEEKRKRKEEKKRKRESEITQDTTATGPAVSPTETHKPKKKKHKHGAEGLENVGAKSRTLRDYDEAQGEESKKRKKKNQKHSHSEDQSGRGGSKKRAGVEDGESESGEGKNKRKKRRKDSGEH
ncbi:MAG: hypothetical protein Q9163_003757 [Psora crenata]